MGKKFHKKYKEIQKLQALHQSEAVSDTPVVVAQDVRTDLATGHSSLHQVIRQDIIFLMGVIALMLVVLFTVRWAVVSTGFEQTLFSLFQNIV